MEMLAKVNRRTDRQVCEVIRQGYKQSRWARESANASREHQQEVAAQLVAAGLATPTHPSSWQLALDNGALALRRLHTRVETCYIGRLPLNEEEIAVADRLVSCGLVYEPEPIQEPERMFDPTSFCQSVEMKTVKEPTFDPSKFRPQLGPIVVPTKSEPERTVSNPKVRLIIEPEPFPAAGNMRRCTLTHGDTDIVLAISESEYTKLVSQAFVSQ